MKRTLRVYAFVQIAIAAIIAFVPMMSSLGRNFEYETTLFYTLLSLLAIPASFLLGPVRQSWRLAFSSRWIFLGLCAGQIFVVPLFVALPGLVVLTTEVCHCSGRAFVFWLAVEWLPTWILAHGIMVALYWLRYRGIRRSAIILSATFVLFVYISICGSLLWVEPPKRTTNALLGFLHGPIYDSYIGLDSGILIRRASHAWLGFAVLFLPLFWPTRLRGLYLILVPTIAWTGFQSAAKYPSQIESKQGLNLALSGVMIGSGFTLRYNPSYHLNNMAPIHALFREAKFHLRELKAILAESHYPEITIYVYPTDQDKKLMFGGGATDVTDVYTPSVHVSFSDSPHPTLRHELVHALASEIAFHGLGFHPNMAFTEGLAMALAPRFTALSLDQSSFDLLSQGLVPDLSALFSPRFWEVSGARAYAVAGSMIQFVIEKFGIEKVKELYAGKSLSDSIALSESEFIEEWRKFITQRSKADVYAMEAAALFREPGLFHARCPHTKADFVSGDPKSRYDRWRIPKNLTDSNTYHHWLTILDPSSKSFQLKLWQDELRSGTAPSTIQAAVRARMTWPPQSMDDVELALFLSDLLRLAGDRAGSLSQIEELKIIASQKSVGEATLRKIHVIFEIESLLPADEALPWRRYLAGLGAIPNTGAVSATPWILLYLKLRNRDAEFGHDELTQLKNLPPPQGLPPTFQTEWHRLIAGRFSALTLFDEAIAAYTLAQRTAPPGGVAFLNQEARRMGFLAKLGRD